jgi:hypothetical protein
MSSKVTLGTKSYDFEGPFDDSALLENQSGIYLVTTRKSDGKYRVIDVGESVTIKDRLASHDRKDQWATYKKEGLHFLVHYCDETTRMSLGKGLREYFKPPCGDR